MKKPHDPDPDPDPSDAQEAEKLTVQEVAQAAAAQVSAQATVSHNPPV